MDKKSRLRQAMTGQVIWGLGIVIALIVVAAVWSSSHVNDVVEAPEAVVETPGEENGLTKASQVSVELVDWFDSDWVVLDVLNTDGADSSLEGFEAYGISAGESIHLWLRYWSDESGGIAFSLPDDADGLNISMDGAIAEGINPWIVQIDRIEWNAVNTSNQIAFTVSLDESGMEHQVLITMPYMYAGLDDSE